MQDVPPQRRIALSSARSPAHASAANFVAEKLESDGGRRLRFMWYCSKQLGRFQLPPHGLGQSRASVPETCSACYL